jgi:hypothetical protein
MSQSLQSSSSQQQRFQRSAPDDFVKEFVDSTKNEAPIATYTIPVDAALQCDPSRILAMQHNHTCVCAIAAFRPVSEEQILHSVKWNELDLQEGVTRLAKKLAEKRVFGPMLMARATVAGTNHSNYSNLPLDGIRYIEGATTTG